MLHTNGFESLDGWAFIGIRSLNKMNTVITVTELHFMKDNNYKQYVYTTYLTLFKAKKLNTNIYLCLNL